MSCFRFIGGSEEELFAVDAVARLVDELVLALLLVQRPQLQRVQLQREARPHFSERAGAAVLAELVAMVAEEDEVALVVHRYHSSRLEIGHLREERGEHAADSVAKHRVEVVHYQLRVHVARRGAVASDLVA